MKFKPNDKSGGVAIELGPEEAQLPVETSAGKAMPLPIFHINKILIPVDFSECSKKAIIYAAALAKQFDAELTLLHILPPASPRTSYMGITTTQEARKELEVLRLTIGDIVPVDTVLRTGTPHKEIVSAANDLDIDLIVISTHAYWALTRALLGSTSEQVVRRSPCPVLVVREKEHDFLQLGEEGCATAKQSRL